MPRSRALHTAPDAWHYPRVLLGVPYAGDIPGPFFQCVTALLQQHQRASLTIEVATVPGAAVHLARNALLKFFLQGTAEYLVMVDCDQVFHPDTVGRLVGWQQPYVSAMIVSRLGPAIPVAYIHEREIDTGGVREHRYSPASEEIWAYLSQFRRDRLRSPAGATLLPAEPDHPPEMGTIPGPVVEGLDHPLLAVDAVGTGMVCLSRECARKLEPNAEGHWFDWRGGGEDLAFSRRVLAAGYAGFHPAWRTSDETHGVFVDRGCLVGHLSYYSRGAVDLHNYLSKGRFEAVPGETDNRVADLAAEIEEEERAAVAQEEAQANGVPV